MLHLLKIEEKPTPSVTINSEGPNSRIESQLDIGKALDTGRAQDTKNTVESSKGSPKKQGMSDPTKDIGSEIKSSSLK